MNIGAVTAPNPGITKAIDPLGILLLLYIQLFI
jgi:hypothetical protein